ncbi:uncharacterized protein [Physcomitrium patens]|uniref:Prolyl endopeptidase n=1 Tax=Physcomitrium patens TaxID=3218 RepID=A0A7I4E0J8_PHYPA|nr:uncharacterized protein LOC112283740 isoform X2 [Physcomitrium patens]|eukprot:XP_024378586.1 uncharacterized protein LOC112283740 isoform X2 [Physcomitrella patens]
MACSNVSLRPLIARRTLQSLLHRSPCIRLWSGCLSAVLTSDIVFPARKASRLVQHRSVLNGVSKGVEAPVAAMGVIPKPPVARKVSHVLETHGDKRIDDYYWIRDDERKNPDVLAYLEEENSYTEAVMADSKDFQESLFQEIRSKIKEDDVNAPLRNGPFFYYTKNLEGQQYTVHCRRAAPGGEGPGHVDEVMETGNGASEEEVLLDENKEAKEHEFYHVGEVKVSPNHKLLAVTEDFTGDEVYSIRVIDIETGQSVGNLITGSTEQIEWAEDNEILFYVSQDEVHRPYKVWRHRLNNNQSDDECLYHEKNEEHYIDLRKSESEEYIFVYSGTKVTQFVLYLSSNEPNGDMKPLSPHIEGEDYSVTHRGNHFYFTRRSEEIFNSELLVAPVTNISAFTVLLSHRPSVKLENVRASRDHLIVNVREDGLQAITIYALPPAGKSVESLSEGQKIKFPEPTYSLEDESYQFNSHIFRYGYSSLRTPQSVYDYDLNSGKAVLKKLKPVLGGFDVNKYETVRPWATASDGTRIPISIIYRKDLVKLDGTDPLFLSGYGSYEIPNDPEFNYHRLSLLDRGVVFAVAHIRGGGELGRKWYEDGKLLRKKNTFTDFISCAEYLLENKYGSKDKIAVQGRSAGGLLAGAVLTMRPDLFTTVIAEVAFVDVLTTMLDPSIPLTTVEWEEWGNPAKEEYYYYMKSYSPQDNIQARDYPNVLVTGGLHDPRVAYWEPSKFVAKLREMKTDSNLLLLKCDMGAGHFSKSGRFDKLKDFAFTYAFVLKTLGILPSINSSNL